MGIGHSRSDIRRLADTINLINELPEDIESLARRISDKDKSAAHELFQIAFKLRGHSDKVYSWLFRTAERVSASDVQGYDPVLFQAAHIGDSFDPHGFFVYLLLGKDDLPVYVGKSTNVLSRLGQHMGGDKRACTKAIQLIRCKSAGVMDKAERELISEHQPRLNVVGIR